MVNLQELNSIARKMVAPGKGLLAADESTGTIKKRFDKIGVENTEDNRRDYRELMFRTDVAMKNHIGGVILFDETLRQKAKDGTPLVKLIEDAGAVPGIMLGMGINSYCNNESSSDCPWAIPITGALFGMIGGGIGYAIDGAIHQSPAFGRPRPSPAVRFPLRF